MAITASGFLLALPRQFPAHGAFQTQCTALRSGDRSPGIGPDPGLLSALSENFSGILIPEGGGAMKRKRYSDEQISFALRQAETA